MIRRLFLGCVAAAGFAAPALSHAFLMQAKPGAGATFAIAPNRVALTFTEKLEPVFSGMAVTDSSGHGVQAGPVQVGGNAMIVPLRTLGPGTYRVAWHVVSVDTHRTEGAYSFKVRP